MTIDPEELLADLGDRIRAERQARGWTQAQLAEHSGLRRRRISDLEAGLDSLTAYAAVCRALCLALDYMLSDRWEMPARARGVLPPRHVAVLRESADGGTLAEVAQRMGSTRQAVGARLSEVYALLDVAGLPVGERRRAAVRIAEERGLLAVSAPRVSASADAA